MKKNLRRNRYPAPASPLSFPAGQNKSALESSEPTRRVRQPDLSIVRLHSLDGCVPRPVPSRASCVRARPAPTGQVILEMASCPLVRRRVLESKIIPALDLQHGAFSRL